MEDAESNVSHDENQLEILCNNVQTCLEFLGSTTQEIIEFNLLLGKYELPTTLLLRLSLVCSKLQRKMSDLTTQVDELTRLVRLYSVPWEKQSLSLKNKQYTSKQHRLDIALKKLEILSGRNKMLERQRVIMNWEKMFLKVNSSKHPSLGWRQVVEEYSTKLNAGESVAYLFRNLDSSAEDVGKFQECAEVEFKEQSQQNDSLHRSSQMTGLDDAIENDVDLFSNLSESEDEFSFNSHQDSPSVSDWITKNESGNIPSEEKPPSKNREFVKEKQTFVLESNSAIEKENIEISPSNMDISEMNKSFLKGFNPNVEKSDKGTSTEENKYCYYLHVLCFKPKLDIQNPSVVVAIGDQLKKGIPFGMNRSDEEVSLELSPANESSSFDEENETQEFCFDVKEEDVENFEGFNELVLRVAVHAGSSKNMIAFGSKKIVNLEVAKHYKEHDNKNNENTQNNELQLVAAIEKDDFKFNHLCGSVRIKCFLTRRQKLNCENKSTETLSLQEIVEEILQEKAAAYRQRCKSAGVDTMENNSIFSEEGVKQVRERLTQELSILKNEYEENIKTIISTYNVENPKDYFNMATSLNFIWDKKNDNISLDNKNEDISDKDLGNICRKTPKKQQISKKWGEKLPRDFFTRLSMFQEASEKYHTELKTETKRQMDERITKQLQAEKKLWRPGAESIFSTDVCLPSVFMPFKSNRVSTPSARSFLSQYKSNRFAQRSVHLPRLLKQSNERNLHGLCVELEHSPS
ncbi:uncharacterized protein LOC130656412 [Hydractinia symbiolongicarpus]|uniref:uncharacterized protein LOC130656412 n=1 Tax=Hydractinia symbiolongicarpus TaxID=13093 RepID=UPI00254C04AF|nr:uncharacterized protein LOC130656412 [Hydractinia symbiolongicarpus]